MKFCNGHTHARARRVRTHTHTRARADTHTHMQTQHSQLLHFLATDITVAFDRKLHTPGPLLSPVVELYPVALLLEHHTVGHHHLGQPRLGHAAVRADKILPASRKTQFSAGQRGGLWTRGKLGRVAGGTGGRAPQRQMRQAQRVEINEWPGPPWCSSCHTFQPKFEPGLDRGRGAHHFAWSSMPTKPALLKRYFRWCFWAPSMRVMPRSRLGGGWSQG